MAARHTLKEVAGATLDWLKVNQDLGRLPKDGTGDAVIEELEAALYDPHKHLREEVEALLERTSGPDDRSLGGDDHDRLLNALVEAKRGSC